MPDQHNIGCLWWEVKLRGKRLNRRGVGLIGGGMGGAGGVGFSGAGNRLAEAFFH